MGTWGWALVAFLALAVIRQRAQGGVPTGGGAYPSDAIVQALAFAIARAEGFFAANPNVLPRRLHNPGDLMDLSGQLRSYPDDDAGWAALFDYVRRMLTGAHAAYDPSMTLLAAAETYTGHDNAAAWASIVAAELGVSPNTTLAEIGGSNGSVF